MKLLVSILLITMSSVALIGCSNSGGMNNIITGLSSEPIVVELTSTLGSTTTQAIGGVGSVLALAKGTLTEEQFTQVTAAIPNSDKFMDSLGPLDVSAPKDAASLQESFSKLRMDSAMASKFLPAVASFVGKSGGATVESLVSSLGI